MLSSIVLLVCALGPPLIGLFAQQRSTGKLTRAQVVDGVCKLAFQYVEGQKAKGGVFSGIGGKMSPDYARKLAEEAALRFAKSKGITLTQKELEAAKVGWELLSTAAKALKK